MKAQTSWYQAVWRWHFYAGIIFAPFLIILAFSGSMYLFKPQIEGHLYKDLLTVREVGTSLVSPTALMEKVTSTYPELKISSVTFPDQPKSTVKMSVEHEGIASTLYADPYSGHILGIQDNSKTFSAYFKKMHSQLLMNGTWPNRLVELSACWAFILTVTGLYLWWPRKKSAIWGTFLPRFKNRGSRTFWRDMHAVPAFWLSLFILILIATGLPWSGVLGPQIDRIANATNTNYPPYGTVYMEKPDSVTVAKDVADNIPWAAENIPVPSSISGSYIQLDMNEIVGIADKQSIQKPYTISIPQDARGVYTISTDHVRPGSDATLHVDQYSGAILTDVRFADYGMMAKAITYGIALHEGRLFGIFNQLLGLITCIGLILISISSYFMWRKRKTNGRLGAPNKPRDKRTTIGVLIIMLIFGILMPLVGLSLIVVLILDLLVIRNVRPLKHWFSA
ncbi:Uncharacterized iron-regulated membrane protein [Fontibacillus panacisegetis]|uniref:Uncharacterized iron-regulated membrane protein n=1 Tax=Fontibacillus panacisegetis TaxID=670482 RepID=A0A1G7EAR3_9BACL|nr:PepSY domain-containing protein [Fontibacillus panacisegetis]SDE60737.1 Uncharacterized iron-regulated membrane protein [Fontibacillus panacisegetis]